MRQRQPRDRHICIKAGFDQTGLRRRIIAPFPIAKNPHHTQRSRNLSVVNRHCVRSLRCGRKLNQHRGNEKVQGFSRLPFKRRPGAEDVEVESIDRPSTRTRLPGLLYFLRFE